jgi:hypothetical protein
MPSRSHTLYGSEEALPPVKKLCAGPLELVYQDGSLRYLRCGGREVLRRIYVAVRDAQWGTIPARLSEVDIQAGRGSFRIGFVAEHGANPVLFRWRGSISGTSKGTIEFEMDGEVVTAFARNRVGLCVIHPLDGFAGQPCEIESVAGERYASTVPAAVSPHQPFLNVAAVSHDAAPGCRVEVRFSGDVFETEDHRNWTDAGFKTYCTPLALPFPVEVRAGERVRQSVTVKLMGAPPATVRAAHPPVKLDFSGVERPLPALGASVASPSWNPEPWHLDRLRALRLDFLRLPVPATEDPGEALRLDLPVEAVIQLEVDPAHQLEAAAEWAGRTKLRVCRWVLLGPGGLPPDEAAGQAARRILPREPIAAGARDNFAELNRNRPPAGAFDALAFPVNPQVHATDILSLMENCAAQRDALLTARSFAAGAPVCLSPVSLHPSEADPRQRSLFCAAWTVASLKYAIEGGAAAAVYFETGGRRGLMAAGQEQVFPVWHVLADVAEFRGGVALDCRSSEPLAIDALVLQRGSDRRVIAANLTPEPQRLSLRGIAPGASMRFRQLTARNAHPASLFPVWFRAIVQPAGGWQELPLPPFAVVTLDFNCAPTAGRPHVYEENRPCNPTCSPESPES